MPEGLTVTVAQITTAIATVIMAVTAIIVAYVAVKGFSDPLVGAIADSVLASTVDNLQHKKADLGGENQKLQEENHRLGAVIQSDRQEQSRLEDQVQTTTSDLNRAREALDQQRLQANKLNNQIKDLDSAKQNAQQELDLVKSQLSTARDEVSEQLRSILVYQAAFLAGEIYDQRFYTSLYQTPPPGVLVATTTPVFTGDDKCFNRFSQSATFTWWSFIDCIGANEKFPWPSDSAEKKRIEDALTKWKNACGRLTREFVIAPKAGQDTKEDRAANEIVEFKIYELSSDASLQNAFCH